MQLLYLSVICPVSHSANIHSLHVWSAGGLDTVSTHPVPRSSLCCAEEECGLTYANMAMELCLPEL